MSDPVASTNSAASKPPGHDIFCTPENSDFMSKVPYHSLSKTNHEIRLLKILPDSGSGFVECELLPAVPLADVHKQYLALSYCAGSAKNIKPIKVNGISSNVFANLQHALTCARRYWESHAELPEFLLWVDQICINQFDLAERSHQVGFMRDIYQSAKRTLICLSTSETDGEGMKGLEKLGIAASQNPMRQLDDIVLEEAGTEWLENALIGFYDILASPWWGRAWVFQEFMVSTHATFLYGKNAMPHHRFDEMTSNVLVALKVANHYPTNRLERYLTQTYHGEAHIFSVFSKVHNLLTAKSYNPAPSDLESLLTLTGECEAADQRDKIYSVLGLASPGYGITPDYSPENDMRKLLVETSKKIIIFDDSLSILSLLPQGNKAGLLPSWVVDWENAFFLPVEQSQVIKMGYFTDHKITAGSIDASFVEVPDPERSEVLITTLQVWAIFLDTGFEKVIESDSTHDWYEGSKHYMLPTSHPIESDQELWILCGARQPLLLSRYSYGYRICHSPIIRRPATEQEIQFPEFRNNRGVYDENKMDWKRITIF